MRCGGRPCRRYCHSDPPSSRPTRRPKLRRATSRSPESGLRRVADHVLAVVFAGNQEQRVAVGAGFDPFEKTVAAVLNPAVEQPRIQEVRLTEWMATVSEYGVEQEAPLLVVAVYD